VSVPFAEQVSAVAPLDGDAIDGAPRRKRRQLPRRDRIYDPGNQLYYGCSNPQCGCRTWSAVEQAKHMATEYWWLLQAVIGRWPESDIGLMLTGGVILKEMTDDECRAAKAKVRELQRKGLDIPVDLRLRCNEHDRRWQNGSLQLLAEDERLARAKAASVRGMVTKFGERSAREDVLPAPDECRALRLAQGLTQAVLGKTASLGRDAVQGWESGRRPIVADKIDGYLLALGIDVARWRGLSTNDRSAYVVQLTGGQSRKHVRPERPRCRRNHSNWKIRKDGVRICDTCEKAKTARWRTKIRKLHAAGDHSKCPPSGCAKRREAEP
jgi:transcriptional regulator with XRE-family HTH domain